MPPPSTPLKPGLFRPAVAWSADPRLLGLYLMLVSLLASALAIKWVRIMDYGTYCRQWARVLDSPDPWAAEPTNAYGPLHNLFAYPYALHAHLPRLMFVGVWLMATYYLTWIAWRKRGPVAAWVVALFLTLTPFFWGGAIHFGFNDVPAAALIFAAVVLRMNRRVWLAGVMLGLATLLKIYPLLMLPFLALDGRRIDPRPIIACVVTTAVGLGLSFLVWGGGTLHPILFASSRPEAKWLSLASFLEGPFSPVDGIDTGPSELTEHSKFLILGTLGVVWLACWRWRVGTLAACIAGMSGVLLAYHVGHIQFWTFLPLLAVYGWAARDKAFDHPAIRWPVVVMLAWLNLFLWAYWFGRFWITDENIHIRGAVGLPHTLLALWMIAALVYHGRNAAFFSSARWLTDNKPDSQPIMDRRREPVDPISLASLDPGHES